MNADPRSVGVIGLGAMGTPIALRLAHTGWNVVVYDQVPEAVERVVADGVVAADSPAAVATSAPLILTSLPGASELRAVIAGERGIAMAAAAATVIDTSTISPAAAREIAGHAATGGLSFLDAPVSGGPVGAERGELVVMVGGDPRTLDRARSMLECLGTIFHCGGVGTGQVCKACNQLVVVGTLELVAEVLTLAAASGLDPAMVRRALLGGYAGSRVLELHGDRMLRRDFAPGGKARFNLKDGEAVRSLALDAGLELPGFEAAMRQIERLVADGGGDLDNTALLTVVEHSARTAQ